MFRRFDPALLAILGLALTLRLYQFDTPYIDTHSWRQVTNADIARLWTLEPINIFFPPVSWGGPDGYVGLEFPLLQALTALVWRVGGHSEPLGRIVPIAFSLGSIWALHALGSRMFGRGAGRGAAFLLACSPTFVFFGRTLFSDVPMVCFSILALYGYASYYMAGRAPRHAVFGAACAALAGLTKVPAILILGPIVWVAWLHDGRRLVRDPWLVAGLVAAVGTIALWYLHADRIFLETGLTQAIFRPSGTYTGDIAAVSGPFMTVSHWTQFGRDDVGHIAATLTQRVWDLHLLPFGAIGAVVGFLRYRAPRVRTVVDVWLLAGLALVLVSLPGQYFHEFHQLPVLPPLTLFFGLGAAPLFEPRWLEARLPAPTARRTAAAALAVAWLAIGVASFAQSPIFIALYRPNHLNVDLVTAGRAIRDATPPDALLVTIEYDEFGTNSPMLLYYAERRGWSFDATSIRVSTIEHLRARRGACFVATSHWPLLEAREPDTARDLLRRREVPLPGVYRDYRLFDLGCEED